MAEVLDTIHHQHQEIDALFAKVSDPEADRRSALSGLIQRLAAHLSVEQSVVLPAVKSTGTGGRRLRNGLKHDYRGMGRLLTRIERRKVNSPDLPRLVTDLQDSFARHVRRCEAFHALEDRLGAGGLKDLSERMERAQDVILSHPHPHLLSLGPISRWTTRIASRVDRARDRTVSNLP